MTVSEMIKQALEKRGYKNLKDASKLLGISPELLRVTLHNGHIPKDKTLAKIASKLGLDKSTLILSAHREKAPAEVRGFFLSPAQSKATGRDGKRIFPISQEQCDYLEQIMSPEEIQLMRKLRQVSEDGRTQVLGYVDYMFATKRQRK